MGKVDVDSRPASQVFVDNNLIGPTPQRAIELPPGLHSVRLYNPELRLVKVVTLNVHPGETISRVEDLAD